MTKKKSDDLEPVEDNESNLEPFGSYEPEAEDYENDEVVDDETFVIEKDVVEAVFKDVKKDLEKAISLNRNPLIRKILLRIQERINEL